MKTTYLMRSKSVFVAVCLSLLCLCMVTYAQNVDSLEKILESEDLKPSDLIVIYDDLSWGYMDSDARKSTFYAYKGLNLAEKMENDPMIATFYRNLGVAYYMVNSYDTAANYLDKGLQIANDASNEKLQARIYVALGNLYNQTSDYTKALDYYMKSLRMFESAGEEERVAAILHNVGALYQRIRNTDEAVYYFTESMRIAETISDRESIAHTLMAMTNIYMDADNAKAIELAEEAAAIFKEYDNLYGETMSILTIAQSHYFAENYKEALTYAERGMKMANESNFPKLTAEAYGVLSNIYYYLRNFHESEYYALSALEIDSTDLNLTGNMIVNALRANIFLAKPETAIGYLDKYRDWIDLYANDAFQQSLSETKVKYETEKKELQISALQQEKRLTIGLGVLLAILLLVLLAFFIIRHRLAVARRKVAEQHVDQLEKEKQLSTMQAILDGETAERSRLAKDLHDGLGSMLSVVKLNLPELNESGVLAFEDRKRFHSALGMLDQSISELRRVAHHMMPESLVRYGLKVSLSDFCDAIPIAEFHYFGNEERLDNKLEVLIYRCAHELVNNALKHAKATQINVQLVQEADRISLVVQDNGSGFDYMKQNEGMGLNNIRQRVEAHRGEMNIYSSTGKGTEVNIELAFDT